VCVGGGNQITASPHKPAMFVIGEGADFGRGPDCISWGGYVLGGDQWRRYDRRQN
jgi:hypothetical protein